MRAIYYVLLFILFCVVSKAQTGDASYNHWYGSFSYTSTAPTSSYFCNDTTAFVRFNLGSGSVVNCVLQDPTDFKGRVLYKAIGNGQVLVIYTSGAATDTILCINTAGMTPPTFNSPYSTFAIVHNAMFQSDGSKWNVIDYR